jgi:hypothetical protein
MPTVAATPIAAKIRVNQTLNRLDADRVFSDVSI